MSQVTLDKVIELMTSRHTSEIKDRHAAMIRRVCSSKSIYADGFPYKELDKVINIIQLLLDGIKTEELQSHAARSDRSKENGIEDNEKYKQSELIDPRCRLIAHCKKDFQKEKMYK